jgi:SAM-dependent methyltransferase
MGSKILHNNWIVGGAPKVKRQKAWWWFDEERQMCRHSWAHGVSISVPEPPPPAPPTVHSSAGASAAVYNPHCSSKFGQCASDSPHLVTLRSQIETPFQEHVYTRRGFSSMTEVRSDFQVIPLSNLFPLRAQIAPAFFDLSRFLNESCSGGRALNLLEQGCGSSRFLQETKRSFPVHNLFGTNFEGYTGYGQVDGSLPQMLSAAEHFGVPVMCSTADGRPTFPDVRLTASIADPTFRYELYFPGVQFDLILSRDALNSMKLNADESHVYIPKMLRALKPGGLVIAQTDYAADYIYHDVHGFTSKPFTIVGEWETTFDGGRVSMLLYKKHEDGLHWDKRRNESFYYSFFGLAMRKCLPSDGAGRGCILPADYVNPFPADLQVWKAPFADWKPARTEVTPRRLQYAFDYHKNLLTWLSRWAADPAGIRASD